MTETADTPPAVPPTAPSAARLEAEAAARRRFRRLFGAVMLPMFLAAVDQTLLATATPVISREFGGLRDTSWLAVSYLLASVIVVPLYGQLGDQFGRRKLLSLATVVFALGSLGCGLATGLWWLVAARTLQGLGGGGLMTLSQALIGEVVSPQRRARSQGYFAIVFTLASVGGPVIGGLVVHHASWRWLFLVNLPLCALALWRLHALRADDVPHERKGPPDLQGLLLFALAMGLSLFWLSSAGHRFDWLSATSAIMLAALAGLWTLLLRVERLAARPFLPIELMRLPPVRYAVLTVVGFASAMFAMVFYLPIYLQLSLHADAAEAGLLLLPLTAGIVGGATLTSRLIVWTGRPTAIPMGGLLLAAAGLLGMALLPPDKRTLIALGFTTGLGLGSVMSVMQIVTQTASGPTRLGAAAATMSLARTLGSSIGASAFGALIFGLIGSSDALHAAQDPHAQQDLRVAFEAAFGCAAAVCVLAAWAASRVPALRFDAGAPGRTDFAE
jgi:EmrB/QacA subfamily drug resistance transporter